MLGAPRRSRKLDSILMDPFQLMIFYKSMTTLVCGGLEIFGWDFQGRISQECVRNKFLMQGSSSGLKGSGDAEAAECRGWDVPTEGVCNPRFIREFLLTSVWDYQPGFAQNSSEIYLETFFLCSSVKGPCMFSVEWLLTFWQAQVKRHLSFPDNVPSWMYVPFWITAIQAS